MNFAKITLSVALLGAFTLGMADTTTATQPSNTNTNTNTNTNSKIDAQITQIQNAPAQDRVQLMNQFKQELANMNQADRMQAISQMQEKMHGNIHNNMQMNQDMDQGMHQRVENMIQEHQAQKIQHMDQSDIMNQMHNESQKVQKNTITQTHNERQSSRSNIMN